MCVFVFLCVWMHMCVPGYISSLITLHNETRAPSETGAYQFWLVCLVSFFWGVSVSFSNLMGLFYGMADTLCFLHGCWEPQLVQIILCQWSNLPALGTQFSEGTFLYKVIISRIKNGPFRVFRTWTVGRYHVQYCQVTHCGDKSQALGNNASTEVEQLWRTSSTEAVSSDSWAKPKGTWVVLGQIQDYK